MRLSKPLKGSSKCSFNQKICTASPISIFNITYFTYKGTWTLPSFDRYQLSDMSDAQSQDYDIGEMSFTNQIELGAFYIW